MCLCFLSFLLAPAIAFEKQMDTLDVTDPHYERKINDLQKRLDAQYDIIEEAENAVEEIRSQIRDLRRDQISSESIYEFLLYFDGIRGREKAIYADVHRPHRYLSGKT